MCVFFLFVCISCSQQCVFQPSRVICIIWISPIWILETNKPIRVSVSCGGHYQYYAYLIKKNGVQMWQSLYDTNDLVAEIMCQLWQEFPPEETWCAWLGTSAECWCDWSCTLDLTTKFTVASAGILVHAPFHPCQVAVTPFGDWVPVDEIYWCSVPGWTALSLAGVIGCQSTVAWWSQQWPPEGNNCVVINIFISLSCAAFVLLSALMFEYIHDVTTAINIFWLDLTWPESLKTDIIYLRSRPKRTYPLTLIFWL